MVRERDGDMTGEDPLSSAAEGDEDGGSAELAGAGARPGGDEEPEESIDGADGTDDGFASGPPHPEALDDTPVTDAPPAAGLEES